MMQTSTFAGVDFHCHLDLYPDHADAIAAAESAGIYTLAVTTTPKAWARNRDLTRGHRFVRPALGLHPQLVEERANELSEWEQYLSEARYVGEVGLDAGPRYYKSLEAQKRIFRTVLECCAAAGDKVLTIHSLRSAAAVLDMIEAYLPPGRGKCVMHWFTGSLAEARRASALGCYFSINAAMGRGDRGRALIASLADDRLLTETDGPFTQTDGRPTRPTDVHRAVEIIAGVRGVTPKAVSDAVRANLKTLLAPAAGKTGEDGLG